MRKNKVNPLADLMTDCPPESPYQLYTNAGLLALGEEYGDVLNDLSDDVRDIMINAAAHAIEAALQAARVSDDWLGLVQRTKPTFNRK